MLDVRSSAAAMWKGILVEHRDAVMNILTEIEPLKAAADEVHRSLRALDGLPNELGRTRPKRVDQISVFFPSNNVLYSYVLLAVIPSTYARRVVVRPSARSRAAVEAIHQLLAPAVPDDSGIVLRNGQQVNFLDTYCAASDVVVFTGRFENAVAVAPRCRRGALFVAFGSGPNAVVIGPDADVSRAVADVTRARIHNSGQDCLCPDVTPVHRAVRDRAVAALRRSVEQVTVGQRNDPETDVSRLEYADAFSMAERFIERRREHVVYGGRTDRAAQLVDPTLIVSDFDSHQIVPELFSPIFNVRQYTDAAAIREWLCNSDQMERGMYLSVYGEQDLGGDVIGSSVVLHDMTAFDVEDGNEALGGFGKRANFVLTNGKMEARPLLLSAEIARHFGVDSGS